MCRLLKFTTLSFMLIQSSGKYNFLLKIFYIQDLLFLERVYQLIDWEFGYGSIFPGGSEDFLGN